MGQRWPVMKGNFFDIRVTKTNHPQAKSCGKTRISTGNTGGNIIHLFGGEQNPARFKIMEVSVW